MGGRRNGYRPCSWELGQAAAVVLGWGRCSDRADDPSGSRTHPGYDNGAHGWNHTSTTIFPTMATAHSPAVMATVQVCRNTYEIDDAQL